MSAPLSPLRDLSRDWHRWSAAERLAALATMVVVVVIPAVVFLAAPPPV